MNHEIWQPDEMDTHLGVESYIRYASGVAILNDPERLTPVHGIEVSESTAKEILIVAEDLMLRGATDVIKYAHPKSKRNRLNELEKEFDSAAPFMLDTVNNAAAQQKERLDTLNSFLAVVRPAPMLHEGTYRKICRSRLYMLTTHDLMDGIRPSALFAGVLTKKSSED